MTTTAYQIAMGTYLLAALLALILLGWWLRRRWGPGRRALLLLSGAAILLIPAYPHAGVDTLAPALVVTAFQVLTTGDVSEASHALRPLGVGLGAAVLLSALLRLTLWRRG